MPLFGNKHRNEPVSEPQPSPLPDSGRRGGFFNRSRSPPTPAYNGTDSSYNGRNSMENTSTRTGNAKSRSFFSSRRHSDSSTDGVGSMNYSATGAGGTGTVRKQGVLRNNGRSEFANEPSILAARQKVADAEGAERDADAALAQARAAVKEARHHVQVLEREAEEDTARAKAKQAEARMVSKSAKGLGRFGA